MGKQSYRPSEDQYVDYRCCCLHLRTVHQDDGWGACDFAHACGCGRYLPVIDPETGAPRSAA